MAGLTDCRFYSAIALSACSALVLLSSCSSHVPANQPSEEAIGQSQWALGAVNWLSRGYDSQRTSANTSETVLNQLNVASPSFDRLFNLPVDDEIYAQPLYASGVTATACSSPCVCPIVSGTHNMVYVATVNNSVYSFDADNGSMIWQCNYNGTFRPVNSTDVACGDFFHNTGIVGTPVIDGANGLIYFVTHTMEGSTAFYRIHRADIRNGKELTQAVLDSGSFALQENQRLGLAFANSALYVGFSSYCDNGTWHGYLRSFDGTSLSQIASFNASPTTNAGGIWHSGNAPPIDSSGNLFVTTGNGTFGTVAMNANYGQSVVKLASRGLGVLTSFTVFNWAALSDPAVDADLSACGPSILPGSTTRLVQGGKTSTVYLLNQANLGGLVNNDTQIPQKFQIDPSASHEIHGLALWNGPSGTNLYTWGTGDVPRAFRFDATSGQFTTPSFAIGSTFGPSNATAISLSASGSQVGTGILWATTQPPCPGNPCPRSDGLTGGAMWAFNAESLGAPLWWSHEFPIHALWSTPTIANGKVYASAFPGTVDVFGLYNPVVSITRGSGMLDIFYRGSDGNLHNNSWNGPPNWTGEQPIGGGLVVDIPTAVVRGARVDVFAVETDGAIYEAWRLTPTSAWNPLTKTPLGTPPVAMTSPVAVARDSTHIDLFSHGKDGTLYWKCWNGSAWSGYTQLGSNVFLGAPAVITGGANPIDVLVRGTDGTLYTKSWNSTTACSLDGWTAYTQRGPEIFTAGPVAVRTAGPAIMVVVRGMDSALYSKRWNSGSWDLSYTLVGAEMTAGTPSLAAGGKGIADVFVRGLDGALHTKSWNGTMWDSTYALSPPLHNPIVGAPSAVSWGANRIDVFVHGTDGAVYDTTWTGGPSFNGYVPLGGSL